MKRLIISASNDATETNSNTINMLIINQLKNKVVWILSYTVMLFDTLINWGNFSSFVFVV